MGVRLELRASALLPYTLFTLCYAVRLGVATGITVASMIMVSLLLHECGHALVAVAYGVKVKVVGLTAAGGYTVRDSSDPSFEAKSALAGPFVNLLIFAIFTNLPGAGSHWVASTNLVLALASLMPFPRTDGCRLWRALSTRRLTSK